MTETQAIARAAKLNRTRYKKSRIKVRPEKCGQMWILIGFVPNQDGK